MSLIPPETKKRLKVIVGENLYKDHIIRTMPLIIQRTDASPGRTNFSDGRAAEKGRTDFS